MKKNNSFNLSTETTNIRNLIANDKSEQIAFENGRTERSQEITVAMSDLHSEVIKSTELQEEVLNDLFQKKLLVGKTPEAALEAFQGNTEMAIVKYVTAKKDPNNKEKWTYARSYNNRAPMIRQLNKKGVKGKAALKELQSATFSKDKDGKTVIKGPQALVEKDRVERGAKKDIEEEDLKLSTAISQYFDTCEALSSISSADCSKEDIEEGVVGDFILLLGRVQSGGGIKIDRALTDDASTTRKILRPYMKDAKKVTDNKEEEKSSSKATSKKDSSKQADVNPFKALLKKNAA